MLCVNIGFVDRFATRLRMATYATNGCADHLASAITQRISMIEPDQIYCVIELFDMRRGLESLTQWIQTSLGSSPCDDTAHAFSNHSKTLLKLLICDGTGVWCCQRQLHGGAFIWPNHDDRCLVMTQAQWDWLIKGVDWQRLTAQAPTHWRV